MAKKTKRRVRLSESPSKQRVEALQRGKEKSFKEARKRNGGKIPHGYKYKAILDGYRENGLEPTIVKSDHPLQRDPMFVVQPSLGRRIIKLIKKGYPYTTVCRFVGITPKTLKDWLEKGKAGYSPDYQDFYEKFCRAEASGEMRTLKQLRKHENADWRVSAWQLERRWPENWSKKDRMVAEMHINASITTDSKEALGQTVLEDDAARALARKLIDGSEFGFARLPAPTEQTEDA